MPYVLLWSACGEDKSFVLKRTAYFIGRPAKEDLESLGVEATPFDVLVYPASPPFGEDDVVVTGYRSLVVSRRHAKLVVDVEEGGAPRLYIVDHGPSGAGSRNGTFVNNVRLEKGGRASLKEGDVIKLSSAGPTFIVGYREHETTVIKATAGVPKELPVGIASELVKEGLVEEHVNLGDKIVVVVRSAGAYRLKGDVLLNSVQEVNEVLKKREMLNDMIITLYRASQAIREGHLDNALMELRKLKLNTYREVIVSLNENEALKEYDNLNFMVSQENFVGEESLVKQITVLCKMLEALKNKLPAF